MVIHFIHLNGSRWIFDDYRQIHSHKNIYALLFSRVDVAAAVAATVVPVGWNNSMSHFQSMLMSTAVFFIFVQIKALLFRECHSQSIAKLHIHRRSVPGNGCVRAKMMAKQNTQKENVCTLRKQFDIMVFHLCGDIPSCFIRIYGSTMRALSCSVVTHHFFFFFCSLFFSFLLFSFFSLHFLLV